MGETNSPSVWATTFLHSRELNLEFYHSPDGLSWVEKYRIPRATEGESIFKFQKAQNV